MEPILVTIHGCDVIIRPVIEDKTFGKSKLSFKFEYDNDQLAERGVDEGALQAAIENFIKE